MFALQAVK